MKPVTLDESFNLLGFEGPFCLNEMIIPVLPPATWGGRGELPLTKYFLGHDEGVGPDDFSGASPL